MPATNDPRLLDTLLDSWDRNHRILINLLRAVPEDDLGARAVEGGRTVAQLFAHVHYVRLAFVAENAPEFAIEVPAEEWQDERDAGRIEAMLNASARVVRETLRGRIESGQAMNQHYDHAIYFLQHMIWHEGYHHGQIKLALKVSGRPIEDRRIGRGTWGVWMLKT